MLSVVVAPSVVAAAVPSTGPRVSAGNVDSAGEEAASAEEGVAAVLVFDEATSVATAVGSEVVVAGSSTTGVASVADVVGSVAETVVAVTASEVS